MTLDNQDTDSGDSSVITSTLSYARVLQLVKQHGVTGLIVVLLAYQLGWMATAQSTMCGV